MRIDLPDAAHPPGTVIGREPVELLDLDRDLAARYWRTSRGVSNAFLDGSDPDPSAIPMGYTQLYNDEQVAIALDGRVVKTWTARAQSEVFVVLVPPAGDQDLLVVHVSHPERAALADLANLSTRMPGVPLLLSRQRSETFWH